MYLLGVDYPHMGLKICSLFSGSTGNCAYLSDGREEILIDAGVRLPLIERALKALGSSCERASVLVTHRHSDHISGLGALAKKYPGAKIYVHRETLDAVAHAGVPESMTEVFSDSDFYVGGVTVSPVKLSHDVHCVGFGLISCGKKITYMTDTGVMPAAALDFARDSDIVVIESNHSPELVLGNANYPYPLKMRILGERGHLSNEACAAAAVKLAESGVKHFILAHLSRENNYPELAYSVTHDALTAAGYGDVGVEVALADKLGALTEIR